MQSRCSEVQISEIRCDILQELKKMTVSATASQLNLSAHGTNKVKISNEYS